MNSKLKLIFFLIFIFQNSSSQKIPFRYLTENEETEIENLEEKYYNQNKEIILSYFNFPENSINLCKACKISVEYFRNIILNKYGEQGLYKFLTLLCSNFQKKNICYGAITRYGPIVLDSFIKKTFNPNQICSNINLCTKEKFITIEEYSNRILSNKPKEIPKPKKKLKNKKIKSLQITDIHLDINYKENTIVNCDIPLCCHDYPLNKSNENEKKNDYILSGLYGSIGKCDANIETVKAFSDKISEIKDLDYIMFTGDNVAHNIWDVTQEEVIKNTKIIIDNIKKKIGNKIPIYPCLGNHEKAPVDEFYGSESLLLNGLGDIFKEYLTKEAEESFRKYGYYTMLHKDTKLRIVSLNCIICDSFNFNLIFDTNAPKLMFDWLENVLSQAEKNNEIVHIMDHIPIGHDQHTTQCAWRLKILLERYQNIIRGYFSGHSHSEYMTIVKEYTNKNKPNIIDYVTSGLTTYSSYNPSFRIFEIDSVDFYVEDFIQYRMNLTESNKLRKPIWFISYIATDFFNVDTMADVDSVNKYEIGPEYVIKKYTDIDNAKEKSKDWGAVNSCKCTFNCDTIEEQNKCQNMKAGFNERYLHYVLDYLMGNWKDD